MKKEMTVLQSTHSAGEYLAPSVKVKNLRNRRVLCASDMDGYNEQYQNGGSLNDDFNS